MSDPQPQEAIEYARYDAQLHVDLDFHGYGCTEGIHVEKVNGVADHVLNDHAACIALDQPHSRHIHLVGNQERRPVMAKTVDGNLSQDAAITSHFDPALEYTRRAILASNVLERNPAPLVVGP